MSNSRELSVFSIQGGEGLVTLNTSAVTFGEFKGEVNTYCEENNKRPFNWENLVAVTGDDEHTLQSDNAVLPTFSGETIFLLQKKAKSGGPRANVFAQIKEIVAADGQIANDYFSAGNGNWTRKGTSELKELVADYTPIKYKKTVVSTTPEVSADITPLVEAVDAHVETFFSTNAKTAWTNLKIALGLISQEEVDAMTKVIELKAQGCGIATRIQGVVQCS